MKVHSHRKVQIIALIANKTPITVLAEYLDFANVFFKKFAVVLSEHTKINIYVINLK